MKVRHDGGCVYTLGRQPGSIIRANHLHDSHAPFGGVYLDEGTGGFEVAGNRIYRAQTPVFDHTCGRSAENKVHDNITAPPSVAGEGFKGAAGPLVIGARSDRHSVFNLGEIDEVAVFDQALGDGDFARQKPVYHWDFENQPNDERARAIIEKAGLEPAFRGLLDAIPKL